MECMYCDRHHNKCKQQAEWIAEWDTISNKSMLCNHHADQILKTDFEVRMKHVDKDNMSLIDYTMDSEALSKPIKVYKNHKVSGIEEL